MRHATAVNQTNVIYSNLPGFPLSDLGRRQAEEAGRFFNATPLQFIITSGRERARETAGIVARLNSGQPKVIVDDRIRDVGLGALSAKIDWGDWNNHREAYWQKQISGEGGMESPVAIQNRMKEAFEEYVTHFPTANILFVSHGDPITFLFEVLKQAVPTMRSVSRYHIGRANVFEVKPGRPVVINKAFEPMTAGFGGVSQRV